MVAPRRSGTLDLFCDAARGGPRSLVLTEGTFNVTIEEQYDADLWERHLKVPVQACVHAHPQSLQTESYVPDLHYPVRLVLSRPH